MSKLVEKLRSAYVFSVGNRATFIGRGLMLTLMTAGLNSAPHNNSQSMFFLSLGTGIVGASLEGGTFHGIATYKLYKRTKKHIEKFNRIDSRFFKEAIKEKSESEPNGKLYGYCQLQGIYFACREHNLLDRFKELKKEYLEENLIPNF